MAKASKAGTRFVCGECGSISLKWAGRCEGCLSWNTLAQEVVSPEGSGWSTGSGGSGLTLFSLDGESLERQDRWKTACNEFDRVCGGGLVPGSVVLVGGDPGIGKSTLLLQMVAALSRSCRTVYISGEEGVEQIRLRAQRLGLQGEAVKLATGMRMADVAATLESAPVPQVAVIDSIQTMCVDEVGAVPGTVSQIRACTGALVSLAKKLNVSLILVGHVTKEGVIAGPRVLEHMVDTVLYFEGERGHPFRLLRAVKNRFGPTDEIGVFDMTDRGLVEVTNPSALFLGHRQGAVPGACVFAGIEGTRPVLVEIQALVSPSFLSSPRRAVVGWDSNRLAMVLAVLEARCGLAYGGRDVYLNVVGGLRVAEPAADLAVAAALVSCVKNKPLPPGTVAFGEIGLSGEIRQVSQTEGRLKEACKLGFTHGFIPAKSPGKQKVAQDAEDFSPTSLKHIRDLVGWFS